ncbi:MAG: hypothetical protein DI617_04810 [Streptococcus pyogenes]|uniref:helix-turn-helix transcriptional regulator n=2 Tax=Streptococcus halichoeri TaxID=254785 RepID=UPI000DB01CC8|nr:MAG: hypothetical protein DI617_04810 [Streptococcus pyogenes]
MKKVKARKKLTQQKLANKIGVIKRTYIYWEKGERQIQPDKSQTILTSLVCWSGICWGMRLPAICLNLSCKF